MFSIAAAIKKGYTVAELAELTQIDVWFLNRLKRIVDFSIQLENTQAKVFLYNKASVVVDLFV